MVVWWSRTLSTFVYHRGTQKGYTKVPAPPLLHFLSFRGPCEATHFILISMSFLWNEQSKAERSEVPPEKKRAAFALLGKLGVLCIALKLAPILIDLVFPGTDVEDTAAKTPTFVPNPALAGLTPSPPSPGASA